VTIFRQERNKGGGTLDYGSGISFVAREIAGEGRNVAHAGKKGTWINFGDKGSFLRLSPQLVRTRRMGASVKHSQKLCKEGNCELGLPIPSYPPPPKNPEEGDRKNCAISQVGKLV